MPLLARGSFRALRAPVFLGVSAPFDIECSRGACLFRCVFAGARCTGLCTSCGKLRAQYVLSVHALGGSKNGVLLRTPQSLGCAGVKTPVFGLFLGGFVRFPVPFIWAPEKCPKKGPFSGGFWAFLSFLFEGTLFGCSTNTREVRA